MKTQRKIPATMASQHPDHAGVAYWKHRPFINTRQEAEECFLSFSDLGISEYKWDFEGKFVDEAVIERLLTDYFDYFKEEQLGRDKFLTFRLPNPKVETEFRLGRAFAGLLSASLLTKHIGLFSPPLFEVILPMTETAEEMLGIQVAFSQMAKLEHDLLQFSKAPLTHLEIIPLFEEVHTIMDSDKILQQYLFMHKKEFGFTPKYMRPYVARSDPALNAGLVPTVLAIKVALSHYKQFAKNHNIALYPIIGSASLVFRGGLTPYTVSQFINEYKGIQTALIQSAFRYDYPKDDVVKAIGQLEKELPQYEAMTVSAQDEKVIKDIIPLFELPYRQSVEQFADIINAIAKELPKRRERVQHIGLFGYSRGVGKVKLPRAIGFTAAMYNLGLPPELVGTGRGLMTARVQKKLSIIEKYYVNIHHDLLRAGRFVNKDVVKHLVKTGAADKSVLEDIKGVEEYLGQKLTPKTIEEKAHHLAVEKLYGAYVAKKPLADFINEAAMLRHSLG